MNRRPDWGRFTRAAEELAIQQPSVSAAIRQLEDTLGTAFILYAPHRNVTLTAAGRLFAGFHESLTGLEAAITATQALGPPIYMSPYRHRRFPIMDDAVAPKRFTLSIQN